MALLKVPAELPESADEMKISLTSLTMSCPQQRLDSWKLGTWCMDTRNELLKILPHKNEVLSKSFLKELKVMINWFCPMEKIGFPREEMQNGGLSVRLF